MCRGRGNQQLRGYDHPLPEDRRDRGEGSREAEARNDASVPSTWEDLEALPAAEDDELRAQNARKGDWISRDGRPDPTVVRHRYWRKSDYVVSTTDPDASFMQRKGGATRLGYQAHYVVDGGKARVILNVLVTPAQVIENLPMLDLLWRTAFRWGARVRRVTADATYGTKEIVAAVEGAGIRAYVTMTDSEKSAPTMRRAGSCTTPRRTSTGARKANPCACTPTPTPRG